MGFIGDLFGTQNDYRAKAPVNSFNVAGPAMQDYSGAISQGLQQSQQARGNQDQYIAALQQQAAGTGGPSPAQQMLAQALQQNQAQAAGTIGSQRGINPALAARMATQQQANLGQQAAGQGAMMRSQEQLNAQGLLGNALMGQRQQDLGQFGQAGQMNLAQWQQAQQLNQGTAAQNAALNLGAQQINAGITSQNAANNQGLVGGLLGGAGAVLSHHSRGGPVPGRAQTAGDSSRNDTVPIMASPGEVVLPRSVAQAEDAPERAAAFVRALHRSKGGAVPDQGYGRVLAKTRELEKRIKLLESGLLKGKESRRVTEFTRSAN